MAQSRIEMLWMMNVFLGECFGNPFNGKGALTHIWTNGDILFNISYLPIS